MSAATTPAVTVLPSILSTLSPTAITTIGSTIDPIEHGGNPYGLAIAPSTSGLVTAGDLIVCNFNDGATNTQGLGTTIVGLHPTAGSMPYHVAQSASLQGCNALTTLADGTLSAAAYSANANPLITTQGAVSTPFSADAFGHPWGEAYVAAAGQSPAALYVPNADGTIDRISLDGDAQTGFVQIVSGFCASGQPGAIYAPRGSPTIRRATLSTSSAPAPTVSLLWPMSRPSELQVSRSVGSAARCPCPRRRCRLSVGHRRPLRA